MSPPPDSSLTGISDHDTEARFSWPTYAPETRTSLDSILISAKVDQVTSQWKHQSAKRQSAVATFNKESDPFRLLDLLMPYMNAKVHPFLLLHYQNLDLH